MRSTVIEGSNRIQIFFFLSIFSIHFSLFLCIHLVPFDVCLYFFSIFNYHTDWPFSIWHFTSACHGQPQGQP